MKKLTTYDKTLGWFFLIVYLLMWPYKYIRYGFPDTLWYCDTSIGLLGLLILLNKRKLAAIIFAITVAMQVPWLYDMILIAFGIPSIGLATYMFSGGHPIIDFLFSLRHVFVIPLTIIYFLDKKYYHNFKNLFYVYVPLFGASVLAAYFLADPETNMNCSRYSCVSFFPSFENPVIYLISFLFLGFLATYLLNKITIKLIHYLKKHKNIAKKAILITTSIILIILILKFYQVPQHYCTINSSADITASCYYFDVEEDAIYVKVQSHTSNCIITDLQQINKKIQIEPEETSRFQLPTNLFHNQEIKFNIKEC